MTDCRLLRLYRRFRYGFAFCAIIEAECSALEAHAGNSGWACFFGIVSMFAVAMALVVSRDIRAKVESMDPARDPFEEEP